MGVNDSVGDNNIVRPTNYCPKHGCGYYGDRTKHDLTYATRGSRMTLLHTNLSSMSVSSLPAVSTPIY